MNGRNWRMRLLVPTTAAFLLIALACKKSPTAPTGDAVTAFVSGASAFGAVGSQQSGPPPAAQTGGPPVTAIGSGSAVDRGVNNYALSSPAPFQKIFISVNASAGNNPPAAADGFLQIDLPAAVTAADVIVDFGDNLPAAAFSLRFQVASPAGVVGTASAIDTTVVNQTVQPVTAFVSGASAFGSSAAQATLRSGPPPAAQPGGPPVTAIGSGSAFNGASSAYGLSSAAPFQKIIVSLSAAVGGGAPATANGFFQIDLTIPVTTADVAVNFGASIPASAFQLRFQIASPGGQVGAASAISTSVVGPPPAPVVILTGQVISLLPPMATENIQSDTTAHLFRERTGLLLTAPLAVDFIAVGTHTAADAVSASIPAGTRIDSHYLIADAITAPSGVPFSGAMTFDTEVLGLIALDPTFVSNLVVGAPGTLYRGAVEFEQSDSVTLSANRRTVSFNVISFAQPDNLRIITASAPISALHRLRLFEPAIWRGLR
jgi:hypothetical protein